MSNQVALFAGGNLPALPEHLRGIEVDEATKALAGGGGGLRLSIKGGVFRMLNNGEEIARNDDRSMNVVIVASSPDTARNYYEGEYVEGEGAAPTCWSANGETPDKEVKNKQSATCAGCPQNIAGSGNGDSRACRFSRSLAVVLDGDIGGKVFKLQVPATSLFGKVENNIMPLQAYGKQLVQHNLPISAVATELRFDTSVTQPKLGFKAARYLTKDEYDIAIEQGKTPEAIAATKTTISQQDASDATGLGLAGAPAATLQSAQTQPAADTTAAAASSPAVVQAPATVAAPAAKRTRTRAAAAAPAETPAADATVAPADTTVYAAASNAAPATLLKVMTDKAEFTYAEYIESKWTDEMLVEEGLMVMEAPKKAAPPPAPKKPAAPPAPRAAAAPDPEPVVASTPAVNPAAGATIEKTAAMLANWDSDEE